MENIYLVQFINLNTGEMREEELCDKLLSVAKKQPHIQVLNVQFMKKKVLLNELFEIIVRKMNEEGA